MRSMKKMSQFNIRVDEDFLEKLDMVISNQAGIRTRTNAMYYCVDKAVEAIKKKKKKEELNE
jgi:metal-responsive CopG/Arc/MetJ family transcriptional regulator